MGIEYQFAVSAPIAGGEVLLVASEYVEGHLDWYAFAVGSVTPVQPAPAPASITRTVVPAPVTYRGMPAPRFWQFEDAEVDFGSLDVAPEDLAQLLLVEFALTCGNDWFVIPFELALGSLCRITSFVVTDTFGVRTLIQPYGEADGAGSRWRMFRLSPDTRTQIALPDVFFLPPVLAPSLESSPIEEVVFIRDEMANLAWAVERVVEGASGRPLKRFEVFQEERRREEREAKAKAPRAVSEGEAPIVYRLASSVPPHWIPLAPVREGESAMRLERGAMLRILPDGSEVPIEPLGHILEPGRKLRLCEEEIPRTGARVTRAYQYARWIDGSTHLWIGRRKQPGRGEGSSGLRFDIAERSRSDSG